MRSSPDPPRGNGLGARLAAALLLARFALFPAVAMEPNVPFDDLPLPTRLLMHDAPGLIAHTERGRVCALYGRPIIGGATALQAEIAFWANYADAFGVADPELDVLSAHAIAGGRFTVFHYAQRMGDLMVEGATARLLVLNGDRPKVVYVSARLADSPAWGFPDPALNGGDALSAVCALPEYAHLVGWSDPELVAWPGHVEAGEFGRAPPIQAWKLTAEYPADDPELYERKTFFVDAATGGLLAVRDEVHHADVTGTVEGYATPITTCGDPPGPCARPDLADNPPALRPLSNILVQVTGGNSAYTDPNGHFLIPHVGTDPVTVTTTVADGRWVTVDNHQGGELALSQQVTPGVPATFTINPPPHSANSPDTAQVNAFAYVNEIHDFFTSRVPGWTGLDYPLLATVNIDDTCNAFFTGSGLQFLAAGGGCTNTAYSSIVAHEYGHFVVHQLGLVQRSFGEGFGDTCSLLAYDDPIVGREMQPAEPNDLASLPRDYSQDASAYPCNDPSVYRCGRVLAGLWRDIREELSVDHGGPYADPQALSVAQQLFADWSQVTLGGATRVVGTSVYYQAAHALSVHEILTVDDDNADLSDGTPHCVDICEAAANHGLACAGCTPPAPPGTDYLVSFQPPLVTYTSPYPGGDPRNGVDPFGIAVADLNNDGLKDVVLACEGSDNVLVFLGQSSSPTSYAFQAPVAYAVGDRPAKVELRHMSLNSQAPDGYHDIIVTLQGDNGVRILLNNGDGTFDPNDPDKSRFEAVTDANGDPVLNPVGLRVYDWHLNARKDIAVAGYQPGADGKPRVTLGVLWGETDGTFTKWGLRLGHKGKGHDLARWQDVVELPGPPPLIKLVERLAITNGDPNAPDPKLAVFKYQPQQSCTLSQLVPLDIFGVSESYAVTAARFNDDTLVDLAACDTVSSHWFEQLVDTTFEDRGFKFTRSIPRGMDAGKLTKLDSNPPTLDSRVDIAVAVDGYTVTGSRFSRMSGLARPCSRTFTRSRSLPISTTFRRPDRSSSST